MKHFKIEAFKPTGTKSKTEVHNEMLNVPSTVSPEMMKRAQEEDTDISQVMCYVKAEDTTLALRSIV